MFGKRIYQHISANTQHSTFSYVLDCILADLLLQNNDTDTKYHNSGCFSFFPTVWKNANQAALAAGRYDQGRPAKRSKHKSRYIEFLLQGSSTVKTLEHWKKSYCVLHEISSPGLAKDAVWGQEWPDSQNALQWALHFAWRSNQVCIFCKGHQDFQTNAFVPSTRRIPGSSRGK